MTPTLQGLKTFYAQAWQRRGQWQRGLAYWVHHLLKPAPGNTYLIPLLALFLLIRAGAIGAGVWFNSDGLFHGMHLVDVELLKTAPLSSIWASHVQPPLYNLFSALILALTPNGFETALAWPLFIGLGWLLALGLFRLQTLMAVPARLALTVALLFSASPAVLYYTSSYNYASVGAVCVLWGCIWLMRWYAAPKAPWHWASYGFGLMAVAAGFHSLFMPYWLLPAVAGVLWVAKGRRMHVLLAALLPLLLAFSYPAKNYITTGKFNTSTWEGLTLMYLAYTFHPNPALQQTLVMSEEASPLLMLPRPDVPQHTYPTPYYPPASSGNPVLDNLQKANGDINFNHVTYLLASPQLKLDALAVLRHSWQGPLRNAQNGLFFYLLPLSDHLYLRSKKLTFYWDWAWNFATAGRVGWSGQPVFHHLTQGRDYLTAMGPSFAETLHRTPWYLVGWFNLLLLPTLIGWAGLGALRNTFTRWANPQPAQRLGLWLMGYAVVYVSFVSIVLAPASENHRYRFYISALLAVYVAMALQKGLARWSLFGLNKRMKGKS